MEGELFWSFDDDVLAGGIPANHVVVLWPFEEAERGNYYCQTRGI